MHDFQKYIDSAQERSQEVEQELAHFDFNSPDTDQGQYEKLNREYQRLRNLLNTWNDLQKNSEDLAGNRDLMDSEEDPEFLEVVQTETQELEARTEKLDRKLKSLILPPLPMEDRNSIVEIRPAAGGDEAGLFAAELLRMYSHFAEQRGWKQELLEQVENAVGGIKSVAFSLQGTDVHRYMKFESGVHRVQRIPETESGGRVHTSTVTVAVLPEAEEVDVQINPEDLKLDVFRSSGPGGQSVNTTDSAVRVTHIPTGVSVASQQEKSQHRNREIAMRILRSRLLEQKQAEEAAKSAAARREQVGTGDRSERIRTYNFPQSRITDHRYNITRHDLAKIMEGELEDFLEQLIAIDVEQRLAEELE